MYTLKPSTRNIENILILTNRTKLYNILRWLLFRGAGRSRRVRHFSTPARVTDGVTDGETDGETDGRKMTTTDLTAQVRLALARVGSRRLDQRKFDAVSIEGFARALTDE